MAFQTPRLINFLSDENSNAYSQGKSTLSKGFGLKGTSENGGRRTFSNITNRVQSDSPLSSQKDAIQTPRPKNFPSDENNNVHSQGNPAKGFGLGGRRGLSNITNRVQSDSPLSSQKDVSKQVVLQPRKVLRNIRNVNVSASKEEPVTAVPVKKDIAGQITKKKVTKNTNHSLKDNFNGQDAFLRMTKIREQAEVYAADGIEKVHFSGADEEAFKAAQFEAEVESMIAGNLNFRMDIPAILSPRSKISSSASGLLSLTPVPSRLQVLSPPRQMLASPDIPELDLDDLTSLLDVDCDILVAENQMDS